MKELGDCFSNAGTCNLIQNSKTIIEHFDSSNNNNVNEKKFKLYETIITESNKIAAKNEEYLIMHIYSYPGARELISHWEDGTLRTDAENGYASSDLRMFIDEYGLTIDEMLESAKRLLEKNKNISVRLKKFLEKIIDMQKKHMMPRFRYS